MVHVILKLKYTLSLFPSFLPLLPFKNRHVSIFLFSIYIYIRSRHSVSRKNQNKIENSTRRVCQIFVFQCARSPPFFVLTRRRETFRIPPRIHLQLYIHVSFRPPLSSNEILQKIPILHSDVAIIIWLSIIAAVSTTVVQHRPTNSERLCARIREREEIYIYRVFPIFSSPFYVRFISGNKFFFLRLLANVSSFLVCEEIIDISYTFRGKFKNLVDRKF